MSDEKKSQGFEEIGRSIGALVATKNAAYGSAFERMGRVLAELFPNGIRPEQYMDLAGIIRVEDKLFRIATDKDAFGEDPWRDVAGYGVLGTERRQRERRKPTIAELEAILKREAQPPATFEVTPEPRTAHQPSAFDPENPLHVELLAAATCKPETEPERTEAVMASVRRNQPSPAVWGRLERAARAFARVGLHERDVALGDAIAAIRDGNKEIAEKRAEVSDLRERLSSQTRAAQELSIQKTAERARCVAVARAEEARWKEEASKPSEQRSLYASAVAVLAAEATANRIARALESAEAPPAYAGLRTATEVGGGRPVIAGGKLVGTAHPVRTELETPANAFLRATQEAARMAEDQLRFERAARVNLLEQVDHRTLAMAEASKRASEAEAKLDVLASRASDAVARFPGIEEPVRSGLARAVREAVHAVLDPAHQSALATLQRDVQKADQRAEKAASRIVELEERLGDLLKPSGAPPRVPGEWANSSALFLAAVGALAEMLVWGRSHPPEEIASEVVKSLVNAAASPWPEVRKAIAEDVRAAEGVTCRTSS